MKGRRMVHLVHLEDRQVLVHSVYEGQGHHDASCVDPCSCLLVVVAGHDVGDAVLDPLEVQQEVALEVDCVYVHVCRTRERPHRTAYWEMCMRYL